MADVPKQTANDIGNGGIENRSFHSEREDASAPPNGTRVEETSKKLEGGLLPDELRQEKRRVWKSMLITCLSMTMAFSASITLVNSITSLLPNDNLGISALAVGGASQVVGAAVIIPVATKLWGPRKMLHVSFVVNTLFVTVFFYPTWTTVLLGAVLVGIGQALIVSTGFMYANTAGYYLAQLTHSDNVDAVLVRVSGMINCALGSGFLWGNVALYFILGTPEETDDTDQFQSLCGAAYCNQELNISTLEPPPMDRYYSLVGLLQVMGCAGCALFFLADDFSSHLGHVRCTKGEAWQVFRQTWMILKNPKGFLLVPITILIGMEESFIVGDITKALISCSLGISMVGLVMLAYGVTEIPMSLGHWPLVQRFGRTPVIGTAVFILISTIITMLLWKPNPHQLPVYFILVAMWAAADSLLMSVIFSTYAALFEENLEGAFSVGIFWWSSGFLFWFGWSQFLCVYVKLYFLIAVTCLSFALYVILELKVLKNGETSNTLAIN